MEQYIKGNGWVTKNTDMGCRYGQTELAMKATGNIIKLVERENFGMLMVTYLKDNGKTIKRMDMVFMYI
jgi:hypothetical protein